VHSLLGPAGRELTGRSLTISSSPRSAPREPVSRRASSLPPRPHSCCGNADLGVSDADSKVSQRVRSTLIQVLCRGLDSPSELESMSIQLQHRVCCPSSLRRGSIPGRGEAFLSCSLCVQTGSGAHPASCTMGTGGPFPGGKARPGRDADHSCLVPKARMTTSLAWR
jgi:hypothetical protein